MAQSDSQWLYVGTSDGFLLIMVYTDLNNIRLSLLVRVEPCQVVLVDVKGNDNEDYIASAMVSYAEGAQ